MFVYKSVIYMRWLLKQYFKRYTSFIHILKLAYQYLTLLPIYLLLLLLWRAIVLSLLFFLYVFFSFFRIGWWMRIWIALFRVLAIPNEEKSIRVKTNLREQYQNDVYQKLWLKVMVQMIYSLILYKRDSPLEKH